MDLGHQIVELLILGIPVASITRTVVYEEIFREPREWCRNRSEICHKWLERKFFYFFTCEYCFSHYISAIFLVITRFRLLFDDWRGYLISFFSLVFVANAYMNLYARLRVEISKSKAEIKSIETDDKEKERTHAPPDER
jgi:hypothetical protein